MAENDFDPAKFHVRLRWAGVTRAELFERSKIRRPITHGAIGADAGLLRVQAHAFVGLFFLRC